MSFNIELLIIGIGIAEILLLLLAILILYAVGKFGQNTSLGFWGSIILSLFISPLLVFLIILIFLKRK